MMCSDLGRKCLLAFSIALIVSSAQAGDGDGEQNCNIKPHVISCDRNKLKYSVVVNDPDGDKIVFNHSVERIPATKPTKRYRTRKPGMKRIERVGIFLNPAENRALLREKLALLIAKKRNKVRKERKRIENKPAAR